MAGLATDDTLSAGEEAPAGATRLAPGARVAGRYQIVRLLGEGGMAQVYEADDLVVGGRVALKALAPELARAPRAAERFRRELGLARRVTHRNVCRLHDLGEHDGRMFLTMELLAGETLAARLARGRIDRAAAARIAADLVDGLAALHAAGVIHRDVKPSNVMFAADGRAVLTDLGLARTTELDDERLTAERALVGTPAYMAPEQVEGREVTPRTDVYALGVVLFELATGELPFREETALATATARLAHDPPRPSSLAADVSPAWEAAILRCLARAPADRFGSVAEVGAALAARPRPSRRALIAGAGAAGGLALTAGIWRTFARASAAPPIATLALVPVTAAGELVRDPDALAVWSDLYDSLARVPGLGVLAWDTTAALVRRPWPVTDALAHADAVVRVAVDGREPWTVAAALLRSPGEVAWSARRRGPDTEAPRLIGELAAELALVLGRPPLPLPADAPSIAPRLYRRYGEALAAGRAGDHAPLEGLVAEAPAFTRAGGHLAYALARSWGGRRSTGPGVAARARRLADAVLARDPFSIPAHVARLMSAWAAWDWPRALAGTAQLGALAPHHHDAALLRSDLLMSIARFDDGLALARELVALDPLAPPVWLAWCLTLGRRFDEAIATYRQVAAMSDDPEQQSAAYGFIAVAAAEGARFDDALAAADRARALGASDYTLAQIATVYAVAGRRDTAIELLARIERTDVNPFMVAWVHASLGDLDRALPLLEQLVDERDGHALLLKMTFLPAPLRAHPRFVRLLERIGFPAA